MNRKTVKTYWTKKAKSTLMENLKLVFGNQYYKTFPQTSSELGEFQFKYKSFYIHVYATKPKTEAGKKKTFLTKRNFHSFINSRPCEIPNSFKS